MGKSIEQLKKKTKKLRIAEIVLLIVIILLIVFFEQISDLFNDDNCTYTNEPLELGAGFNSYYTQYEGTNVRGSLISDLIKVVNKNNDIYPGHQVLINESNNKFEFDIDKTYSVKLEYDDAGYVYNINILKVGE